jgi:hypothetical protein
MAETSTFTVQSSPTGMPAVWQVAPSQAGASLNDICGTLAFYRSSIETVLTVNGGLLVRGFQKLCNAADFERAILEIAPALRDYIGGTSPRSVIHGKIMTATYVPPEWSIPLHQEMAYTRDLPARISFFCERPATVGGYSTVGDMRMALDRINPGIRRKFDRFGLQLRRTLPSLQTLHLKPGVQKPWSEVFNTHDRSEVEKIVTEKGWRAEWRSKDTLQLWQDLIPAIKTHPVTRESLWCNQAHFFNPACMLAWALEDGRKEDYDAIAQARASNPEMLDHVFLGNGQPVPDDDALHVYRILRQLERSIRLDRGDLLILDNLILAHGRTSFEGERSILVALADRSHESPSDQTAAGARREEIYK